MDATVDEFAVVAVDACGDDGGIAEGACDADACGGAEIAEAVGDEVSFVDFHGAGHMRPVAEDDVGSEVDAVVGKVARRAAVFVEVDLGAHG